MANSYKNIVITPNIGNTADPKIQFSGGNTTSNTDINLYVYPYSNGTLSIEGSAGQLFSIDNDLSNSLFSVANVSGLPSLEIFANGLISVATFGGNVVFGNTSELILSPGTGLYANGGLGTAGQILSSNGSSVYWATATDNNTTYDLAGAANVAVNEGLIRLTSSSNANDDVKFIGANGIVVSSNSTAILLTNEIIAGLGLTGATANTIAVVANSGIVANSTGVFVNANTGIVANATGVYVNASYIATISSNSASFVTTGSSTNTFTVGTATYFVSNGNIGIANAAPTDKFSVNGTSYFQANVTLNSALIANGGAGSAGQVLTSNGTTSYWATPTAASSVNTAEQYSWTNTHTFSANVTLAGVIANGSIGAAGQVLQSNGSATYWNTSFATVEFIIDGDGCPITTGIKGDVRMPYNCVIEDVALLGDQTGSIVVDLWKDTYANYPPTVADTIAASAKPTLSSASKYQDSTLTGWTKTIDSGDIIRINVDSAATVQRVTLSMRVRKT